jgi:hypothetical protein
LPTGAGAVRRSARTCKRAVTLPTGVGAVRTCKRVEAGRSPETEPPQVLARTCKRVEAGRSPATAPPPVGAPAGPVGAQRRRRLACRGPATGRRRRRAGRSPETEPPQARIAHGPAAAAAQRRWPERSGRADTHLARRSTARRAGSPRRKPWLAAAEYLKKSPHEARDN